jgi:hypothetical protein
VYNVLLIANHKIEWWGIIYHDTLACSIAPLARGSASSLNLLLN